MGWGAVVVGGLDSRLYMCITEYKYICFAPNILGYSLCGLYEIRRGDDQITPVPIPPILTGYSINAFSQIKQDQAGDTIFFSICTNRKIN